MSKTLYILLGCTVLMSAPAAATNLSGPRAELRGGWDKTTLDGSYDDGSDRYSEDASKSGFNIGAEIGYDALVSPTMTAGVYAGIESATTKECSAVFGNDEACLRLGRNFTAGARLGAKVGTSVLLYVKGGYSNGQLRATYENADDSTLNFSDHANRGGYHLGLGGEFAVGPNGYVGAEYVRTNYSGYTYSDPDFTAGVDGHRDEAVLRAGIRF